MARLFLAIWPPSDVVDLLTALPRPEVAGLRWTAPEQWHVTLRFLGRIDDTAVVTDAVGALPGLNEVEASLGPTVGRFGQRVLHVPVTGLGDVAEAVIGATADLGEPPDDRRFAGHITLARVTKHGKVDIRHMAGTPIAATWPVDEVTLVESRVSQAGARYEVLERFPLSRSASSS